MVGTSVFTYPGEASDLVWVLVGRRGLNVWEVFKHALMEKSVQPKGFFIFSVHALKCTGENPAALPETFL